MATEQYSSSPSVDLWINTNPIPDYPNIDAARLHHDAADMTAVNRLCSSVLFRQSDGQMYYSKHGTYLHLKDDPPLLSQMGLENISLLTSLIDPLNEFLKARAETIRSNKNPVFAIKKLDKEIEAFGSKCLLQALVDISGSRERVLTVMDETGKGGTLLIPPHALMILPKNDEAIIPLDSDEIVLDVSFMTELDSHAGAAFVLRSSSVSEGVRAGTTARVFHPRTTTVNWQTAGRIERISTEDGNKK